MRAPGTALALALALASLVVSTAAGYPSAEASGYVKKEGTGENGIGHKGEWAKGE